jgi:hypothetical protein
MKNKCIASLVQTLDRVPDELQGFTSCSDGTAGLTSDSDLASVHFSSSALFIYIHDPQLGAVVFLDDCGDIMFTSLAVLWP